LYCSYPHSGLGFSTGSTPRKSLERKIGLQLEDENLNTTQTNIIDNMLQILEKVALKLQENDKEYFCLSELINNPATKDMARQLWEITDTDCSITDDATARVAVRSLLVRVETGDESNWPVDFCHRSMREYFVAMGLCRMLLEDLPAVEELFKRCYLNYEEVLFASQYIKKAKPENRKKCSKNLLQLIQRTKSKHSDVEREALARLGRNCVNLLYQYECGLPGNDWSNLILDNAELPGANLSGKDFSYTSLRNAILDNANFENSNFHYSDLTGVRLEETYETESIAVPVEKDRIYAAYADGVIRKWELNKQYPNNLYKFQEKTDLKLFTLPQNGISILHNEKVAFFDKQASKLHLQARFKAKQDLKLLKAKVDSALVIMQKGSPDKAELQLIDLKQLKVVKYMEVSPYAICEHLGFEAFAIYDETQGLRLSNFSNSLQKTVLFTEVKGVTCLSAIKSRIGNTENTYLIGFGQKNGAAQVWRASGESGNWSVECLFTANLHDCFIKDITFFDQERIISSGLDGRIYITKFDGNGITKKETEFKLELRCSGMKVEGLMQERERKILEGAKEKLKNQQD
jgi:hypothetical protein